MKEEFSGIGAPAQRALANAGYTKLSQLSKTREADLAKLHGVGPKALAMLKKKLAESGKAFAK